MLNVLLSTAFRGCSVVDFNARMLFHCCDAERGSSGAGVYEFRRTDEGKNERYVVGLFSGNRDVLKRSRPRVVCSYRSAFFNYFIWSWQVNYNAALRLKESDVFHICSWMKRLGGESCKKVIKERRRRRRRRHSRKRRFRSREERCEGVL